MVRGVRFRTRFKFSEFALYKETEVHTLLFPQNYRMLVSLEMPPLLGIDNAFETLHAIVNLAMKLCFSQRVKNLMASFKMFVLLTILERFVSKVRTATQKPVSSLSFSYELIIEDL